MNHKTKTNPSRSLSKNEAGILTELSYHNKTIFTPDDLRGMTDSPRNVLDQLIRKKWLLKIKRGVYVIVPLAAGRGGADSHTLHNFVIGSLFADPHYIGYASALNYYGFTEQIPPRTYVATARPKNGRRVLGVELRFIKIADYKWFGVDTVEIDGQMINMSSPEKTIVDCLDRPEHAGGIDEVGKALYFSRNMINLGKMAGMAIRMKNTAVIKRLGYLSEVLGLEDCLKVIANAYLSSEYAKLEPKSNTRGKIVERWKLRVNTDIIIDRWMS